MVVVIFVLHNAASAQHDETHFDTSLHGLLSVRKYLGTFSFEEEHNQQPECVVIQQLCRDRNYKSWNHTHEGNLIWVHLNDLANLHKTHDLNNE